VSGGKQQRVILYGRWRSAAYQ